MCLCAMRMQSVWIRVQTTYPNPILIVRCAHTFCSVRMKRMDAVLCVRNSPKSIHRVSICMYINILVCCAYCLCVIWSFLYRTKSAYCKHTHTHSRSIVCQDKERALKKSTSLFLVILTIMLLLLLLPSSSSLLPINAVHVNRFRLLWCGNEIFSESTFQGGMTSTR